MLSYPDCQQEKKFLQILFMQINAVHNDLSISEDRNPYANLNSKLMKCECKETLDGEG